MTLTTPCPAYPPLKGHNVIVMIGNLKKTRLLFVRSCTHPAPSARTCAACRRPCWGAALCNACVFGVSGRSRQAAGLVGIVLTSVICVCLSGTRQHHGRETDTLQRVTELKPGTLCLEGGGEGRRSAAVSYRPHTCTHSTVKALEPIHTHTHTGKQTHTHTHSKSTTGRPGSVIFTIGLFISHYQVMSGNFISNQSAAMIYLFRLSW